MAKLNTAGVYQKDDGFWAYRFTIIVDGRKITRKKTTDEFGGKLKTKTDAVHAREQAIQKAKIEVIQKRKITRKTFEDVYKEYCDNGRSDRCHETKRKQDCLWRIHLCKDFGKRFVDDVSPAEIQDYLAQKYYDQEYSYQYTESILKMFYLIFGQAYTRNHLDIDTYSRLCLNKGTKIKMPPLKVDDDMDIKYFTKDEIRLLDAYFEGTTAQTAYYLGRYCGLRINEAYGLKWDHIDLENGTITIDRQMAYHDGIIVLAPVKTRNSNRTIYLNDKVLQYFRELHKARIENADKMSPFILQNSVMIKDIDKQMISCMELVNTLPNGKIRTVNSMKFHTKKIKSELGITFKFHYLRHTYGTMMAEMNTPEHLLLMQMGHSKIETTKLYYLAVSESGVDLLKENLNNL